MKKSVGYICYSKKLTKEDLTFDKIAKKKNLNLVIFNLSEEINEKELENKIKKCSVVFNNSAEKFALELVKTIEEFGVKVIEPSDSYYHVQDKWLFFLKLKDKIKVPDTIILSQDIKLAEKEIDEFGHWPVILKRVEGTCGDYVAKADNKKDVQRIIKKFYKKGSERLAIVAQEFINSPCYRVTVIDGEIVQAAVKEGKSWKRTGVYAKKEKEFIPDKTLTKLSLYLGKLTKMHIYGIDFLKKGNDWIVLEINSEPALDFVANQTEKLIEKTMDFLKKETK